MSKKSFHEALAIAMRNKGYNDHKLATGVSVSAARVALWRSGREAPTKSEFGRVCAHFREMRAHPPARFGEHASPPQRARVANVALAPGALGPGDYGPDSFGGCDYSPLPDEHGRRATEEQVRAEEARAAPTFGASLRRAREAERMSQEELGAILDVNHSSVSGWEADSYAPIRAHYDALVALLPALRAAPEPDWRDMAKPGPQAVAEPPGRPGEAPPAQPAPEAASPPAEGPAPPPGRPAGPNPVQLVLAAYAEVHPGDWELRVSTSGGRWSVGVQCAGRDVTLWAESVDAACAEHLRDLDEELAERARDIEKLRALVRGGRP